MFLLAAQQRDVAFAVLLVVACLAKESLALFVLIFAVIAYGNRPIRQILRNLVLQTIIFLIVYQSERLSFSGNDGASLYRNFAGHWKYIFDNTTLYSFFSILLFSILLFYRVSKKPVVLQRSMLIMPVMLILYFVGGQAGEFRIVYDVFPVVLLPIADTLRRMFAGADHTDVVAYHLPGRPRPLIDDTPVSNVTSLSMILGGGPIEEVTHALKQ
jgi:hypothetical protein